MSSSPQTGVKGVGAKPWIKMRTDLWDDPRVAALCDALGVTESTVIGGLYRLWSIADSHSEDGDLRGLTGETLDRKAGVPGFAVAMERVGWLIVSDGKITIPRFAEHNGGSAKSRANGANRQQKYRARTESGNGAVTPPSRTERDNAVTRLDEMREDEIRPPPPSSPPPSNDGDPEWLEVEEELLSLGLGTALDTVKAARDGDYSLERIREVIAFWKTHPEWGAGAIRTRIKETSASVPAESGYWPFNDQKPASTKTSDDAHLETRFAQLLNGMKDEAVLAAMALAGIPANMLAHVRQPGTKIRAQLMRHLAAEDHQPSAKPVPASACKNKRSLHANEATVAKASL